MLATEIVHTIPLPLSKNEKQIIADTWDASTATAIRKMHPTPLHNLASPDGKFLLVFHGENYLEVLCQLWQNGYTEVEYNDKYFDKRTPHVFVINPVAHTVMAGVWQFCKEMFRTWYVYQPRAFAMPTGMQERIENREVREFDCYAF